MSRQTYFQQVQQQGKSRPSRAFQNVEQGFSNLGQAEAQYLHLQNPPNLEQWYHGTAQPYLQRLPQEAQQWYHRTAQPRLQQVSQNLEQLGGQEASQLQRLPQQAQQWYSRTAQPHLQQFSQNLEHLGQAEVQQLQRLPPNHNYHSNYSTYNY